jgi:hypothetical protein
MIITAAKVKQHISDVTSEQIGKCHKAFADGIAFYMVESESGDFDQDGELVEYKVTYSKQHGFSCTCPSGKHGFANVKHASGVCKHCRWAVACAIEEKKAMAELAAESAQQAIKEVEAVVEGKLFIGNREATSEEYARVMTAKPAPVYKGKSSYNPKPFSILR